MGHRTNRNSVTVTRRAAARGQARAGVLSLAPVLALLVALTAGGLGAAHIAALLHESSLARTMPTDRILTCRCDTTLVGRGRSSD